MIIARALIIAVFFNVALSDFTNSETGWSYVQSTFQGFYLFQTIEIDNESVLGNGCAPNQYPADDSCPYCFENLGECDVVGAFLNGTCVGWVYADSSGWTTVPVMGNDGGFEDYPNMGDDIEFIIYDSSEQRSYDITPILCTDSQGNQISCSYQNMQFYMIASDSYLLDNDIVIPESYDILNTYPNPFNPSLNIDFFIDVPGMVDIQIYDIMGNLVDTIVSNSFMPSGVHSVIWDAKNYASGEYLVSFKIDDVVFATKMVAYIK